MHEYAVTEGLINTVLAEAKKAGAVRITGIKLVIGELSNVFDESVQTYFDIMSEGTIAHGARLIFSRVPAEFKCMDCGLVYNKSSTGCDCTACGGLGLNTGKGREFYIESMDVE
jgi:hydrogenase nickel incorporation protein HypA/HybF